MLISLTESRICFSNDFLSPTQEWHILLFNVKKPLCETEDVHYSFNMRSVRGNHIPRTFRSVSSQMGLILGPFFLWPLRKADEISRPHGILGPGAIHVAGSVATLAPECPLPLPKEALPATLFTQDLFSFLTSKLWAGLTLCQQSVWPCYLAPSGSLGLELRKSQREINLKATSLNIK